MLVYDVEIDLSVEGILQLKRLITLQTPVVNFKTIFELRKFWCRSILSQDVLTKIKGVTSRRRNICKWAFLQVASLILWFRSTLPLFTQIVQVKTKL